MGAEQSNSKSIRNKLLDEINDYVNGKIPKNSLRYQFFLMNADNFFGSDQFYQKVRIHQISDYISDLGYVDIKEAKTITQKIIELSECDEVATCNLQFILPKMRVKYNDLFISPAYSRELFNQIFSNSYKTAWGKYSPKTVIDWTSPDIKSNYQAQSQDKLPQIEQRLYQLNYIAKEQNRKENGVTTKMYSKPVIHSEDIALIVAMNPVENLLETNNNDDDSLDRLHQGVPPFQKKISKPINWKPNIHYASFWGDESSIMYTLSLLPILLNCPDRDGNTPAHKASIGDQPNVIKLLTSFCANFSIFNKNGCLPYHESSTKNIISLFDTLGYDINEPNMNGESLLELKTKDFNMNVIETVLKMNTNIYEPNPKGVYWMQLAIHGEFYKKHMDFQKFQKKVRKILIKKLKQEDVKNPYIKEILARKVNKCDEEDTIDINNSVTNKNLNRVKALLALGAHPDRLREDGKTNLMICAERNDYEIGEILAKNYCDVNFKNERGENIFWIASYLMNVDVAIVLRDNGANINEYSKTGNTALHTSYNEKRMEVFYFLLETGCSPNIKNKDKESVLFQAFNAKDDVVAELIQERYNGDINTTTHDDNSLAHLALLEQNLYRLDYYIRRGIDLEIKNNLGYTVFMISIAMFDNIETCRSLLKYGSNIDTQDMLGNTPLLNILHSKKFNRSKFDFLLENNCNINIQNTVGEFPISVCILQELNEEAQILLDRGCMIKDQTTEFEPIANALKIGSQYWFETLLYHGATASNTRYPVLVNYINSNFYNFELLKKFSEMNVVIGGPIQAALRKYYNETVFYIWDISSEETRYAIAKQQDSYGMIPISVALVCNCEIFVNYLLSKNYEVMTPDFHLRTPFSYACEINQINWMSTIFSKITIENANIVDSFGNSALTYTANNNNASFCSYLFVNNIEVFNINLDQNGIIDAYQRLLNKFNELKQTAFENFKFADSNYEYWRSEVSSLESEISSIESRIRNLEWKRSYDNESSVEIDILRERSNLNAARSQYDHAVNEENFAERIRAKYNDRYNQIMAMTRNDLLKDFNRAVFLAQNDGDIHNRRRIAYRSSEFDFVSGILSIVGILTS